VTASPVLGGSPGFRLLTGWALHKGHGHNPGKNLKPNQPNQTKPNQTKPNQILKKQKSGYQVTMNAEQKQRRAEMRANVTTWSVDRASSTPPSGEVLNHTRASSTPPGDEVWNESHVRSG